MNRTTTTLALRVLLAATVASLAACDQSSSSDQAAARPASESATTENATTSINPTAAPANFTPLSDGPKIRFANMLHEFGDILETDAVSTQFEFTNVGSQTLTITDIKATCGCTTPALAKREYAPGESGKIDVTFDPTAPGDQKKYINVISNDPADVVRLTIAANVLAFIDLKPEMLKMGNIPLGQGKTTYVSVTSPDPDFTIETVYISNEYMRARVLDGADAEAHRTGRAEHEKIIEVVVQKNIPWGGQYGWLEVTMRGKPTPDRPVTDHTSRVRVASQVFGQLEVTPYDAFRFGAKPGESIERTLNLVRLSGEPFEILDAKITSGGLPQGKLEVVKLAPNEFTLTLTCGSSPLPTRYNGDVTVRTNVPGEDVLIIPIFGVIRADDPGVR